MQLEHSFTVPVGVEDAWKVLLDVEKIAPCMPGATLGEVNGDEFTGTVKVKLGPIGLTYKGKARFSEKNVAERRAVIEAAGKDARGSGTAKATVTTVLEAESPDSTRVVVQTDLNITGKPAQFGRGVMADVGGKLIGQFADCLEAKLAAGELDVTAGVSGNGTAEPSGGVVSPSGATPLEGAVATAPVPDPAASTAPIGTSTAPSASAPARSQSTIRAAAEIDLLATVGVPPALKYAAVAFGGVLVGAVLAYLIWGQ
jgi:carbon monoxide dehydrogenase subunit G